MFHVLELSKYMVTKCMNEKQPITNLQLQKILYYIQKEFLSMGEIAFYDDFEAWQFGPVVPNVYYYFCGAGSMPIALRYDTHIKQTDSGMQYVDRIVESKRVLKPWDLVEETHKAGGAWDQIFADGKGLKQTIPMELIRMAG